VRVVINIVKGRVLYDCDLLNILINHSVRFLKRASRNFIQEMWQLQAQGILFCLYPVPLVSSDLCSWNIGWIKLYPNVL